MDIYGNEAYNIRHTLEKMNDTFQDILRVLRKPDNLATRVLKFVILITGALGILHVADLIRRWIMGG